MINNIYHMICFNLSTSFFIPSFFWSRRVESGHKSKGKFKQSLCTPKCILNYFYFHYLKEWICIFMYFGNFWVVSFIVCWSQLFQNFEQIFCTKRRSTSDSWNYSDYAILIEYIINQIWILTMWSPQYHAIN